MREMKRYQDNKEAPRARDYFGKDHLHKDSLITLLLRSRIKHITSRPLKLHITIFKIQAG